MAKRKFGKKKTIEDQIRDFDPSFPDEALSSTEEQLKSRLIAIQVEDEKMSKAQEDDQDLKDKVALASEARKVYAEHSKASKLKKKLIISILEARGKV